VGLELAEGDILGDVDGGDELRVGAPLLRLGASLLRLGVSLGNDDNDELVGDKVGS